MSMFALSGVNQFLGYMAGVRYVSASSAYSSAFTPPTAPVTSAGAGTLLLLNGTNAGIFDSTAKNNIVTSPPNGYLSVTQSKFGGSCLRFPGGTAINTMAGPHNSLGQGDYTVEMWIWFDGLGFQRVMGQGTLIAGEFLFIFNPNGSFDWCESGTARVSGAAGATTTNTWYHIAIVRYGLTGTAYVNGQQNGTTYTPATNYNYNATTPIYIGAGGAGATGGQTFAGYIDDLRITVGAARYTGNFTIPSSAYPNQ